MGYQPYQATVVFTPYGQPEIVMQESFPCDHEYPAEAWASALADDDKGSVWLTDMQIVTITYWYTWRREVTFDESDYTGAHRR